MNEQENIRFNYTLLDDGSYEVKQGDLLRGYLEKGMVRIMTEQELRSCPSLEDNLCVEMKNLLLDLKELKNDYQGLAEDFDRLYEISLEVSEQFFYGDFPNTDYIRLLRKQFADILKEFADRYALLTSSAHDAYENEELNNG